MAQESVMQNIARRPILALNLDSVALAALVSLGLWMAIIKTVSALI